MIRFISIKKQYKITSMYLLNPFILPQWPEQTSTYSTYFNISADNGVIVEKYGKTITNNGATVVSDNGINCISFNGTSNYIRIPNINAVNTANGFFMTAVVKANSVSYIKGICGKTNAGASMDGYGLYYDLVTLSPYNVWGHIARTTVAQVNKYTYTPLTDKIVITFFSKSVGTTITNKLYVNGVYLNTVTITGSYSELGKYFIGGYGDQFGQNIYPNTYFNGKIYNIMQGSGTLTDADVLAQYKFLKSKYKTV